MGYRLNRLDEPVFVTVPKALQTEFGIHYRLESCGPQWVTIILTSRQIDDFYNPEKSERMKIVSVTTRPRVKHQVVVLVLI